MPYLFALLMGAKLDLAGHVLRRHPIDLLPKIFVRKL